MEGRTDFDQLTFATQERRVVVAANRRDYELERNANHAPRIPNAMIRITLAADSIDEPGLRETFYEVFPPEQKSIGHSSRAIDVIRMGLVGRLQISDGERTLFETEGEGPGETVNILGVLFSAYFALDALPQPPHTLERGFWPDWESLFFGATLDGRMRIALTASHWVVGTPDEWRDALARAFDDLRSWVREHAPYLEDNDFLRPWINDGPPPDLLGPFA